jgi:hypothetical protein
VHQIPNAGPLPIAQPPPARHPRSASEFLRQHLPRNATAKDEQDAGQTRTIRNTRPSAFRSRWRTGKKRFDQIPQPIWKERGHTRPRYRAKKDWSSHRGRGSREGLLHALRKIVDLTAGAARAVHAHDRPRAAEGSSGREDFASYGEHGAASVAGGARLTRVPSVARVTEFRHSPHLFAKPRTNSRSDRTARFLHG